MGVAERLPEPLDLRRLHARLFRDRLLSGRIRRELPERVVELLPERRELGEVALDVVPDEKVSDPAGPLQDLRLNLVHWPILRGDVCWTRDDRRPGVRVLRARRHCAAAEFRVAACL
jgi:hypothetical protein